MKKQFLLFLFTSSILYSQTNTEVHVFDIVKNGSTYNLTNGKNISNNEGYDNQPYFFDTNKVVFASTRNGKTER